MRLRVPVVVSILAHVALLLVALKLPARTLARASRQITIDFETPVKLPPAPKVAPITKPEAPKPEPPKPEPPKPVAKPKLAPVPAEAKPTTAPLPAQEPPPTPEPPPAQNTQPSTGSSLSMRNPQGGVVDLNLHGLGGVALPGHGDGTGGGGTIGSTPRKPWKPRGDAGDPLLGKLPDEKEERFPLVLQGDGYHYDGPSFSARVAMDGRVTFDEHSVRDFKGLSGGFDLTDIAMRSRKQDPYRYEKEKFMETTAKLRGELATRAQRDRLESSLLGLPGRLEALWADGSRPARERRQMLYAMWREAAGSDAELGPAAKTARHTIERFIRERLPEGSVDAYGEDELRRLNARGGMKFEPYRVD